MQKQILKASEILEDKFKIKPERTRLYIHENIAKFLSHTRHPNSQSIFFPRDLSAHVPRDRLDLVMHEYFGHGLYCEHTRYGKKMVGDEQRVLGMNKEEVKMALRLNELLRPTFEAHALWTEDFLLRSLGRSDILERRLEELRSLSFNSDLYPHIKSYRDIHRDVKEIERRKGIFDLWYSFGFPRQFDKETLTEIARERLKERFSKLAFLIHFGSSNPQGDIDLCAVLCEDAEVEEYRDSRTVDFTQFGYQDFVKKSRLFEITVTQPLITGELIYGDEKEFLGIKERVIKEKPTKEAITYLQERSRWCFDYANGYFRNFADKENVCLVTLNNLAYALSFHEFALRYKEGSDVITLSDVNLPLLTEIRKQMKEEADNKSTSIYIGKVRSYLGL